MLRCIWIEGQGLTQEFQEVWPSKMGIFLCVLLSWRGGCRAFMRGIDRNCFDIDDQGLYWAWAYLYRIKVSCRAGLRGQDQSIEDATHLIELSNLLRGLCVV